METLDAIASRRSIRAFKPDPVDDAVLTRLLEAARLAPSGTNVQPWKFLVVRAEETRNRLREAAYGQSFFSQAPVVIVALGDRNAYKKRLRRGKELVDVGAVSEDVMECVSKVYRKHDKDKNAKDPDVPIMANCMIAIEHLVLAAADAGLGTCWVRLMKSEEVADVLNLPDHLFPVALLPVGVPAQAPQPRPRYLLSEIAFNETLDQPWQA